MKHFSYFVKPGAKYLNLGTEENCLAFLVYCNELEEPVTKTFAIGDATVSVGLQPKSLNTLAVE